MNKSKAKRLKKISTHISEKDKKIALYETVLFALAKNNNMQFQVKITAPEQKERFQICTKLQKDIESSVVVTVSCIIEPVESLN